MSLGANSSSETVLDQTAQRLFQGLERSENKFRGKTYKRCFTGRAAVGFLVEHIASAKSRRDAVNIGQQLLQRHYFQSVGHNANFSDDNSCYRFDVDAKKLEDDATDSAPESPSPAHSMRSLTSNNSYRSLTSGSHWNLNALTSECDFELPFEVSPLARLRGRAPVLFDPSTEEYSISLEFQDLGVHDLQRLVQKVDPSFRLVRLDLRGNQLQYVHAAQLCILMQRNKFLRRLDVSNNKFGKQGVKVLSAVLEYNSSLMHLDLSSNLICRDSGGFLAQVLKQRTCALQTLNLSNNPLDELGAKTLAAGLTLNKSLRKLGLSGCNIGDQGLGHIANSIKDNTDSTLVFLDVSNNSLTDMGILKFYSIIEASTARNNFKFRKLITFGNCITTASFASVCSFTNEPRSGYTSRSSSLDLLSPTHNLSLSLKSRRASHDSLASSDVDSSDVDAALELSDDEGLLDEDTPVHGSDSVGTDSLLNDSTEPTDGVEGRDNGAAAPLQAAVDGPADEDVQPSLPPPSTHAGESALSTNSDIGAVDDDAFARAIEENRKRVAAGLVARPGDFGTGPADDANAQETAPAGSEGSVDTEPEGTTSTDIAAAPEDAMSPDVAAVPEDTESPDAAVPTDASSDNAGQPVPVVSPSKQEEIKRRLARRKLKKKKNKLPTATSFDV